MPWPHAVKHATCPVKLATQEMYDSWPFFKGLLDLVEMVMAKADPRITSLYDSKLTDRADLQVRR